MIKILLCEEQLAHKMFSHYAYGDPAPVYARYYDRHGNSGAPEKDAVSVFVTCQRPYGHIGPHMAVGFKPWGGTESLKGLLPERS